MKKKPKRSSKPVLIAYGNIDHQLWHDPTATTANELRERISEQEGDDGDEYAVVDLSNLRKLTLLNAALGMEK